MKRYIFISLFLVFLIMPLILTADTLPVFSLEKIIITSEKYTYPSDRLIGFINLDFDRNKKISPYNNGLDGFLYQPKGGGMPAYYYDIQLGAASLNTLVEGSTNISLLPQALRNVKYSNGVSLHESIDSLFYDSDIQKKYLFSLKLGNFSAYNAGFYSRNYFEDFWLNCLVNLEANEGHKPNTDVSNRYFWFEFNNDFLRNITGYSYSDNGYFEFQSYGFKSRMVSELFYNSLFFFHKISNGFDALHVFDVKKYNFTNKRFSLLDTLLSNLNEKNTSLSAKSAVIQNSQRWTNAAELGFTRNFLEFTGFDNYNDYSGFINFRNNFRYNKYNAYLFSGVKKQENLKSSAYFKFEFLYDIVGISLKRDSINLPMMYRFFETAAMERNQELKSEFYRSAGIIFRNTGVRTSDVKMEESQLPGDWGAEARNLKKIKFDIEISRMFRDNPVVYEFNPLTAKRRPVNKDNWRTTNITVDLSAVFYGMNNNVKMVYMSSKDQNGNKVKDDIRLNIDYILSADYSFIGLKHNIEMTANWVDYNSTPDKLPEHRNILCSIKNRTTLNPDSRFEIEIRNLTDVDRQVWYLFPQPGIVFSAAYSLFL